MKSDQNQWAVFFKELIANSENSLTVELSAINCGKEHIFQSLNLCKKPVKEEDDDVLNKDVFKKALQHRVKTVYFEIEYFKLDKKAPVNLNAHLSK